MTDFFKGPFILPLDSSGLLKPLTSFHYSVKIGKAADSAETIRIGDIERRAGLYILGGSGSGKTELIKQLILQDIANKHGVFFLDPHGDAIDDLIERVPEERLADVVCLDVRERHHSFGINLLACTDISDISEREDTLSFNTHVLIVIYRTRKCNS